nr:hypothetical protein [Tanacetum cinerariifolium]
MPIPGNLITANIQGEPYYEEYLKKVANHQRYLVGDKGSNPESPTPKPAKATKKSKPSAPKADLMPPVTKLTSSQQLKPKSAPAKSQGKKHKLVTETSDKPSPARKSRPGLVTKRRKPTSSLRDALQITPVNNNNAFSSPPSSDALINFVNDLGYPKVVRNLSNVVTNEMFQPWRALITIINMCFTGKTFGFERPRAPRKHKFHSRPDSPLYFPNEEHVLGYLKFSAKGTKREVFGMPIPGNLITANIQARKSRPGLVTKRRKPTSSLRSVDVSVDEGSSGHNESSSLYGELGLTDSKVESDEDVPGFNVGVQEEVQARPNPGEQDEGHARPNPGEQDEGQTGPNPGDAAASQPLSNLVVYAGPNLERMELEATDVSTQPHPKQMDEGFTTTAYPKVQENLKLTVEEQRTRVWEISTASRGLGKGKEKVTNEQVSLDLLNLQTPKKKSHADQFIFQRRTSTPTGSSGHNESSSLYSELGLTDSKVESDEDVPGFNVGVQEEVQDGPNPGEQDEGHARPNHGEQDEGQTGPNPGDAAASQPLSNLVVHAGPNLERMELKATDVSTQPHPKQMDEGFTTTAYPKVQENLKLTVKEQVILEEPAGSTGILSSL